MDISGSVKSGTSKIGRLNVDDLSFVEFAIPEADAMPIGITPGADGNMWFCAKRANKIGRIGMGGNIALFPVPTSNAGPDGTLVGPDGNVWFSETEAGQIGRITPDGLVTEFRDGITPGGRPLSIASRDGMMWFSEAAGNRIGCITLDGKVAEYPIPSHDSQPRAMAAHSSRRATPSIEACRA